MQKDQKCRLVELNENYLIVFDYADRKRYQFTKTKVIERHIRINPKPLNSNEKCSGIDELIKKLYNLCGKSVFLEYYSHEDCPCWKVLNPFTNYREDKIVLCKMDDGIEKALILAIEQNEKNYKNFFGKEFKYV